jgi:hypothetical protein
MKKSILVIPILILYLHVFAADIKNKSEINNMYSTYTEGTHDGYSWRYRKINYALNARELSKEFLCSTKWIPSYHEECYNLIFYLDDVFKMGTCQAGVEITGKYAVVDKTSVKLFDYNDGGRAYFKGGSVILRLHKDVNDFWFSDKISSGDNRVNFYPIGGESKVNTVYNVGGARVLKLPQAGYSVVKNVKFRIAPSINSKTIETTYLYNMIYKSYTKIDFLVRGQKLFILGRSEKKETVNTIQNYWYFISVPAFEHMVYGWVFGEYIEMYNESKEEEYFNDIKKSLNDIGWKIHNQN